MKNPPVLVAVLGFFGALAGFGFIFMGFRMLGFDWFGLFGDLPRFESVGLWGWLAVITGFAWLLAALGLWSLQPWARLFAMIMAGFGLIEATVAFFQFPGTGIAFSMAIMPALVLWYFSTSEVKQAFGLEDAGAEEEMTPEEDEAPMPLADAPAAPSAPAAPPAAVAAMAAASMTDEPEPAAPMSAMAATAEPAPPPAPAAASPAGSSTHVPVIDVEGIGPAYAEKLVAIGIINTDDLLAAGSSRGGRERLAASSGISQDLILEWVNRVDLMRVPGVGAQYSDLLEMAGVDSPAELAQRNPANLAQTFQEVVAARPGTVRRIASEAEIAEWVEAAKSMPKVVEH